MMLTLDSQWLCKELLSPLQQPAVLALQLSAAPAELLSWGAAGPGELAELAG